ncbi:MAG: S-layer homology domain-containing protein [Thermoleophilia bacterium]
MKGISMTQMRLFVVSVLVILSILLMGSTAASAFPDVPSYDPYADAIDDLAGRGIINGFENGTFGPDKSVTRQQFAKMIVLTLGLSASEADVCQFSDVTNGGASSLYPDNFVAVAAARGITNGTGNNLFSPHDDISRAQVITMVVRAVENLHGGVLSAPSAGFTSTWNPAYSSIHGPNSRNAEYNGLLAGLPLDELDPWDPMPRGEVAQVLHNLLWILPWQTITYSGTGDDVVTVSKDSGPALAYVTGNAGGSYFGVTSYGAGQQYLDLVVNTTDPYVGIRPIDFGAGQMTTLLEVEADGPWQIELHSLADARVLGTPGTISGSGDEVIALRGGPTTVYVEGNDVGQYFGVFGLGSTWDLLANETDPYAGRSLVDSGVTFLEIQAVGPWTIVAEP